MQFPQVTLADAGRAEGVVVVIDVLRAFTLAAFALDAGAVAVRCVATVEEALDERAANPGSLAMGEVNNGQLVADFDLGNSPTALAQIDVAGRLLIHRSSAGTQGLVAAAGRARALFAASFVCAGATARAVAALAPDQVTFVLTGVDHRDGDEDRACADYLTVLLDGGTVDPEPYLRRVRSADAAQVFAAGDPVFPASDIEAAVNLDAVGFALRAEVAGRHPTLVRQEPPDA